SARCALVAAALLGARRGDRFDPDTFATRFAQIAATAGLDLDALWRNPGSKEDYPFTRPPLATTAA
ncbi:hypothetical protein LZC13_10680, partial [Campylobacter coli]|nr:hypothetical protein [Campylobacter coli]